jgi:hypothetical protein
MKKCGVYAMAPVTAVVKTCVEPSTNVTVIVTVAVVPNAPAQPAVSVLVADSVCPGFRPPVHVNVVKVHVPGRPLMFMVGLVVLMGTSPVFFNTTVNVPASLGVTGEATNFTWSISAVGLLPAMLAKLKKTPETTTAAATVIAISRITATNGLKPTDLYLLISTTSLHMLYL